MSFFDNHPLGGIARLNSPITALSTAIVANSAATPGDPLPDPGTVGAYNATLVKADALGNPQLPVFTGTFQNAERVRLTVKATDTYTSTRGQEGTTALAFSAGDYLYAAIGPLDFTHIESQHNGAMPAWIGSAQTTYDDGNLSRMRLARGPTTGWNAAGFLFAGASYNNPKKAGLLLQMGEYPEVTSGGVAIGDSNCAVFLSMDDMPSQIGTGAYVQFHIVGQNSAALPNVWGGNFNIKRVNSGGVVYGMEVDVHNGVNDAAHGVGYLASGDPVAIGVRAAFAGFQTQGNSNGHQWKYGAYFDAIDTAANGGTGLYVSDAIGGAAGIKYGVDLTGVTGGMTAAMFMPNAALLRWQNTDASNGWNAQHASDDNFYFTAGKAAKSFYILDSSGTHVIAQIFATTGLTGQQTALLLAYNNAGMVYDSQVSWKAGNTLGAGDKVLVIA